MSEQNQGTGNMFDIFGDTPDLGSTPIPDPFAAPAPAPAPQQEVKQKTFKDFLEKKGLRHIWYHDLRHSCASLLIAKKVDLRRIQEWLGHSDFTTTQRYIHLTYANKEESAVILNDSPSMGCHDGKGKLSPAAPM